MSFGLQELAAAVAIGGVLGGGLKLGYNRLRRVMTASDDRPIRELSANTAAADVIAKAAAAVVTMLQGELKTHSDELISVNVKLTQITAREKTCQERLTVLEAQVGIGGAGDAREK